MGKGLCTWDGAEGVKVPTIYSNREGVKGAKYVRDNRVGTGMDLRNLRHLRIRPCATGKQIAMVGRAPLPSRWRQGDLWTFTQIWHSSMTFVTVIRCY